MKPKIIAMYLPQYHQIPENDEFWGEGFTDWVTVKNAKPLFEGHQQPRVPLNENYYDLSKKENIEWQCKLAQEYGIYGFGIYHYWFNNDKNLLTKPAEIILENEDIETHFFFAWDNMSWKRSWSNVRMANDWAPLLDEKEEKGPAILIPYILGSKEDWRNHYNYLLPYFKDKRYIKKENRPVFMILHHSKDVKKMCEYWEELAREDGFDGLFFIFCFRNRFQYTGLPHGEYVFKYEPSFSGWVSESLIDKVFRKVCNKFHDYGGLEIVCDYDKTWKRLLKNAKKMSHSQIYHGAFVSFDDTPRRGRRARLFVNSSPEKFESYLSQLVELTTQQEKEFIFVIAWNEWGEGAVLEPDNYYGVRYLQAIRNVVEKADVNL